MSVAAIRSGLAARLATISGLRTSTFEPDKVSPPLAVVGLPETIDYDTTMARGTDTYTFTFRVYVTRATDRNAQDVLGGYLDPSGATSVKAAVEGDKTLAGAAQNVRVVSAQGVGVYDVAGTAYVGAEFTVLVRASGV